MFSPVALGGLMYTATMIWFGHTVASHYLLREMRESYENAEKKLKKAGGLSDILDLFKCGVCKNHEIEKRKCRNCLTLGYTLPDGREAMREKMGEAVNKFAESEGYPEKANLSESEKSKYSLLKALVWKWDRKQQGTEFTGDFMDAILLIITHHLSEAFEQLVNLLTNEDGPIKNGRPKGDYRAVRQLDKYIDFVFDEDAGKKKPKHGRAKAALVKKLNRFKKVQIKGAKLVAGDYEKAAQRFRDAHHQIEAGSGNLVYTLGMRTRTGSGSAREYRPTVRPNNWIKMVDPIAQTILVFLGLYVAYIFCCR